MKKTLSLAVLSVSSLLSYCQSFHYTLPSEQPSAATDAIVYESDVELINMVSAVDVKIAKPAQTLRFLLMNEQGDTLISHKGFTQVTPQKYRLGLTELPDGWYYINFFSGNHHFVKMFYYGKE